MRIAKTGQYFQIELLNHFHSHTAPATSMFLQKDGV